MSQIETLHEAFAELERRADLMAERAAVDEPDEPAPVLDVAPAHRRPRIARRGPMLAAAAVAVAAVTIPTTLLLGHDGHHSTTPGARPLPTVTAPAAPVQKAPPPATHTTATTHAAKPVVPTTPAALARKLREALAGTATFTYTALVPHEPVIGGILTDKASGRQGGFDLQIAVGSPGDQAQCEDPGTSHCTVSSLPDGSSLSVGRESPGGGAELYLVNLVRPDGVTLLMHVSNQTDPKGSGAILGSKPPLTTKRIVAVLRSKVW